MALGLAPGGEYAVSRLELAAGQGICAFTDGVTECEDPIGAMFGLEGLRRVLASVGPGSHDAAWSTRRVVDSVREFAGGRLQSDDITCVVLRRRSD